MYSQTFYLTTDSITTMNFCNSQSGFLLQKRKKKCEQYMQVSSHSSLCVLSYHLSLGYEKCKASFQRCNSMIDVIMFLCITSQHCCALIKAAVDREVYFQFPFKWKTGNYTRTCSMVQFYPSMSIILPCSPQWQKRVGFTFSNWHQLYFSFPLTFKTQ